MRGGKHTELLGCIRTGDLKDVQRCFSTKGNLDKLNPLLTKKFEPHGETALHLAVKYRREDIVKWLLQLEADIHATDCFSRTVLHTATDKTEDVHSSTLSAPDTSTDETKHNNIIELILSCEGVNVNATDEYGHTPVKIAAESGKCEAVRLLLNKTANITIADKTDNTTLHVAAKKGHKDVLELLLKTLGNNNTGIIGKQNKDKDTPLHLAVTSKNPTCVALLLNAGAASTMEVKNEQGQTVTDLAREHGNEEIIKLLKNPQKVKEFLLGKAKSVTSKSSLGRFCSVESDSSAINAGRQELVLLHPSQKIVPLQVNANQVIFNQQINTNISGGTVAVGPGSHVVNAQDLTAVNNVPLQSGPPDESNFDVTVTGGNACVGVRPVINVAPGTPGTPGTAGSRDGPFFPGPQENNDTSSGYPTENPSTELLPGPCQEASSSDKLNESARLPVQEQSQADKLSESARRPVQEEFPADKSSESARRPVQEEFPADKLSESARRPVQEEQPTNKSNLQSLSSPVQEECSTDKLNVSSTSPVEEKSTASLPFSVPEQKPALKADGQINSSHMSNQPRTEGSGPGGSSTDGRVTDIGPANDIGTVDNAAIGTVKSVRDGTVQEVIAPFDAVEAAEDSSTTSNSGKALLGATSFKPDEASKQTWQRNLRSGSPRNTSPITRSVPKAAQDRLLHEVNCSPSNDMFGLDPRCGAPESQLKLSGNRDVALPRVSLADSSGTSLLVKTPEKPKSTVAPSINVASNVTDAGPYIRPPLASPTCGSSISLTCAPSPSCSKESSHRKAQQSRDDAILDSNLPAGAVSNVNQSMRTACNGEASFPGNHHGDNPVGTSRDNISSGTQSSADGHPTSILKDDNPEDDRKGHQTCEPECRLM
ncbi:uncharacterized protein PB18E9.04c-like [Orbicella faveolata]|uniref:uncharacterized protein PB18E9.04c-like n=1 Tax=Orbicella faveolata TaxID=48498 RepID=UPI0009E3ED7E|nr:uncharacterized protein PB18E9.04c-like [Orbicella faveolata]XP_020623201.1 uncharacterized protein PB18E9.04c-like [Orbicella faveolata]